MKLNQILLLAVLLFFAGTLTAQKKTDFLLHLKNGSLQTAGNISKQAIDSFNSKIVRTNNKSFAIIQFESIPTQEIRNQLLSGGIELLEYIPNKAYTVSIKGDVNLTALQKSKARSVISLSGKQKMQASLADGKIPSWAIKVQGTVDLWISFPKTFSVAEIAAELKQLNADLISTKYQNFRILTIRIASNRIEEIAAYPFVEFIQPIPSGDHVLNYNSRSGSRANVLNASVANGGKGLNGEGIVVGVGDNADLQDNIDFTGRLINRAAAPVNAGHGHHTSGTVTGNGNGLEQYRGYAPNATIIGATFNSIILNAPAYVNDYGMVITNNSYGDNIECGYHGTYDLYSRLLDQMAFDLPNLTNVFSAGNSGTANCPPALPTYHTVLGGYQSAKNVITVGATTDSGAIASFSSRGPVKDGRTKPEIVAQGQQVASNWFANLYGFNNGTSMSGPAVAGGLTLLYQRYKQLNSGNNPKNGLMKALIVNGAVDKGNAGPDFQYGFGWMNLLRSIDMMENNRYFNSNVAQGATNTHTINVPGNTAQLKVMLYWNDPAASPLSGHTLVNDLDLEVVNTTAATVLPFKLDTSNANVATVAITGDDHINNMEQVVINSAVSGNYSFRVKGNSITQNPTQEYFLVYDIIPVQLKLTAPFGGEVFAPSTGPLDRIKIRWEAFGFSSGTITIEFSSDNGSNWTTLETNVDINRTTYTWFVPNIATSQARIRITKAGSGETSTSDPFTIIARSVVSLAPVQCEGYVNIQWTSVAGATDYEVMMLQGNTMIPVAITSVTSYSFSGLSKDSIYWFTVRSRVNGVAGTRAAAISKQPNTGACTGSISDNDLKLDAILSPFSGRKFTSNQLTSTATVSVRIKNLDDTPVSNFDVKYSINGSAFITENVSSTIAAGATYTHIFSAPVDLSATGNYKLVAVVTNNITDVVTANDTAIRIVKHLDNQPLDITSYFVDNIETASSESYEKDTIGLTGLDRYDLTRSTIYGRLRTFVNSGIAYSGSKALTLDANRYYIPGNTNYLYGTYNLINYNVNTNDLRLDFRYNNHGQVSHANNKVWIRGNDTQPWIEVYDLDNNQNDPGTYKKSESIELSDMLVANGQTLGTSFQVRWGQFGQIAATDKEFAGGYSFDDIRIYQVFNDLQMLNVDEPLEASCGLTNASVVKVSVRNSSNTTITNIPVKYRINNGNWITETINSIAGNATVQYSFNTKADLSAVGTYSIQALVDLNNDSFRENDTITASIIHSPVITSFPYLQNFEVNNGSWYSKGKNNSWQYGTPVSNKINRAASGAKAWKTRLAGNYNDLERSYLYSPCFDLTGMSNPTLSFSVALDIEDCGAQLCDGAWVEYSADGISWSKLGAAGSGTNWYNKVADQLWSIQNYTRWHVATVSLPSNMNQLRIRFVFETDEAANREGIAIDDIHVYNNTNGIYDGLTMTTPVTQTVSGNNWIDFTSAGKLVASIKANNQNPGLTAVQAFINTATVRYTTSQYYHDRNITIKPASNSLNDSVAVRFYFLDKEVDSLIMAKGCNTCTKPSTAYELGVSKYSDIDPSFENGNINDNNQGIWNFIKFDNLVMVPFDKGYYAEFKVKDFSEFWLNNGGFDKTSPLPVKLLDLTVQKQNNDVLIKWKTGSEANVDRYEIEIARGNLDLQAGNFSKIGEVISVGSSTSGNNYNFLDTETEKFGPRYYRLKIVNQDGSFSYSPIRSVVFSEAVLWQVYPNPSKGIFNLVFQLNNNEELFARIIDAKGRAIKDYKMDGNGFLQKLKIDLTMMASGVYLLQINAAGKKQTFKLFKE